MSDEDDYMSSTFLEVKEDVRPGLLPKAAKRKLEIEKKRIESNKIFKVKSRKELEEESRNIGLDSAIGSDNIGFAMLQKMGYKPGMKLGPQKSTTSDRGLMEPIRVKVKNDKGGLGREEEIRKRIEKRETKRQKIKFYREKETEILTEEFRERMRNKCGDRQAMRDLIKCQKVCQQLDEENGVREPMRPWFWYQQEKEVDDKEDEEEEEDEETVDDLLPEEKINFITEYIHPKYFYCVWCCIKFENEEDLNSNCPGPEKFNHEDLFDE
ncbi:hypothetical protein JTE90_014907 [Oedothorax gibbosus]|uniref:G patch domain-containing protein 11 n=1 Tax=Oedothorax gibbosus TaxID=931172 RepID=A0AAV6VL65_9ARAC|nr:hypothetical protein JTE90_014907 [Oedothorax gibbosus]